MWLIYMCDFLIYLETRFRDAQTMPVVKKTSKVTNSKIKSHDVNDLYVWLLDISESVKEPQTSMKVPQTSIKGLCCKCVAVCCRALQGVAGCCRVLQISVKEPLTSIKVPQISIKEPCDWSANDTKEPYLWCQRTLDNAKEPYRKG